MICIAAVGSKYVGTFIGEHWGDGSHLTNLPIGSSEKVYTTNYITYASNYYAGDTYVNDYFTTNILIDNTVSNYFATNQYFTSYTINTNLTITNFVDNSSYVSNFWFTNLYTTNFFSADTYVSNYFTTNIFNTTQNITTNYYNVTTNVIVQTILEVQSNAYFYNTQFVNYSIVTNLYVTNAYITNITANRLYVTENITYVAASPVTNVWSYGPTGNIDLAKSDQYYEASGDMSVSGFSNKSNNIAQNVLLTIKATGANRTIYYPNGLCDALGASSAICTNGVIREIWFRYSPSGGGMTNVISQSFFR